MKEFLASGSRNKLFKEEGTLYVKLEFQKPEPKRFVGLSTYFEYSMVEQPMLVGPCHHGMERPQVADRGTASDKEGSCE